MAATATVKVDLKCAALNPEPRQFVITANGQLSENAVVAKGVAGAIDTNGTGVDGLATGHGITTQDKVTITWTGGARRYCTVSVSEANAITVSDGDGTALPAENTAVVVSVETVLTFPIDGNDISLLVLDSALRNIASFREDDGTLIETIDVAATAPPFIWFDGCGFDNPLVSASVAIVSLSNVDIENDAEVLVYSMFNPLG